MGMDGKACLLRAICEIFQVPFTNHGFFGEVLELFLSASRAPHAEKRLKDYTRAERIGRSTGECFEYHKACPHSLFTNPGQLQWVEDEEMMDEAHMDHTNYNPTNSEDRSSNSNTSKFLEDFVETTTPKSEVKNTKAKPRKSKIPTKKSN
ncbi:hypothetical protein SK128_020432 [Halocaridina rubra]|uniref:Uncharacterized protein n=1 Tax=Halocaridina rubra TaxID=373956 RepID=A0AAN8ZW62_HALRR